MQRIPLKVYIETNEEADKRLEKMIAKIVAREIYENEFKLLLHPTSDCKQC